MLSVRRSSVLALTSLLCLGIGWCRADPVPTGDQVMDRTVEALGGKKLLGKFKNRVSEGAIEIPTGQTGQITISEAMPNKVLMVLSLPGGKVREGSDGETAWSEDPSSGALIKEGEEKAIALREARFNGDLEWRQVYKSAECLGVENVDGKPCYKVKLTLPEGAEHIAYYDKNTYLPAKLVAIHTTPAGKIEVVSTFADYRPIDGMQIAHRVTQTIQGRGSVATVFTKIQHNVDIPESRFALPEAIRNLKNRAGSKK